MFWGYLVGRNGDEFRELEHMLGDVHASSKIDMLIEYADGLDESCRTL